MNTMLSKQNFGHQETKEQIILLCCKLNKNKLTELKISQKLHDEMGISISENIYNEISQLINIGLQIRSIKFQYTHDVNEIQNNLRTQLEEKYSTQLGILETKLKHTYEAKNDAEEQTQNWKDKFQCIQNTVKHECKQLAIEQGKRVQENTAQMQHRLENSIDDMKTKMIQFHSKTASTKTVGNKGEQCIMSYIADHYPNWILHDTHGEARKGDFHTFFDNTNSSFWILNEVKTHKGSIRTEQIRKFYRDIDENNPNFAILYSLYSNIVGKTHGEYELRGKTHIIFLANVASNMNCIQFAHSICTSTLIHNKIDVNESKDELEKELIELKRQQQLREFQNTAEQNVHNMRAHTKHMISCYEKNIQHSKKKIEELKKNLHVWSEFQQENYINDDKTTMDKFPWKCSLCNHLSKSHIQLYKHISTINHVSKLKSSNQ